MHANNNIFWKVIVVFCVEIAMIVEPIVICDGLFMTNITPNIEISAEMNINGLNKHYLNIE